jgi:GNAT superfamily N-acetyltransferase
MLKGFEARGLVERTVSAGDRRSSELRLTAEGQKAYGALDALSQSYIDRLIEPLRQSDRDQLADAMQTIEALLDRETERSSIALRSHRPGDMGWVVERHGAVYNHEHGWDERFEALVARITAQFIESFDAARERCWIAELAGRRVGSVFLVKDDDRMARLRLLFVDPSARGLGLGRLLVDECIRFARNAGYRGIRLWTQQNLVAARHIYAKAGFRMTHGEPHPNFGHDLVSEFWELDLGTMPENAA